MRAPILVFSGGPRAYASRAAAERALAPGGARAVDAFDAEGRVLQLRPGRRSWFGFGQAHGVQLVAGPPSAEARRTLRTRLADALIQAGAPRPWAEGAPLGALVQDAASRLSG